MPRPRGGDWLDDEMASLAAQGVTIVVSALERSEAWELELEAEAARCRESGMRFLSFPIPDRHVPASAEAFGTLTLDLATHLEAGETVVVHCRAGIGRSSLIAAGVLARNGSTVSEAFAAIQEVRGLRVPDTTAQISWLESAVAAWPK